MDRFTIEWDERNKLALFQKQHARSSLWMAEEEVRCQLYRNVSRNRLLGLQKLYSSGMCWGSTETSVRRSDVSCDKDWLEERQEKKVHVRNLGTALYDTSNLWKDNNKN